MPKQQLPVKSALLPCLATLLTLLFNPAQAATLEDETTSHIETLRAIRASHDQATLENYNRQMNSAWQFFDRHKPQVLPILRRQLRSELVQAQPNDLILLDVGLYLHENDAAEGKAVARDSLFRLNPHSPVVDENHQELFDLVHAVAEDHDPRVLPLIDQVFLRSDEKLFIPQHSLELDGTLTCVFLYGAYGGESETLLRAKLSDPSVARRALEVLIWLGTPKSVKEVGDTLARMPDYDTLARVSSFMMEDGGPAGRDFMLALDPNKLDARSRQYLAAIRGKILEVSFDSMKQSFASLADNSHLSDEQLKARLQLMIANDGKDDQTNPMAVLNSGLDTNFLVAQLLEVRARTFFRLSDEALNDARLTNALINTLRYKAAAAPRAASP